MSNRLEALRNVAQRSQHEENSYIRRCIVDGNRGAGHGNSPLGASLDVDVVVAGAVVAYVLQALRQRIEELVVEVARYFVRIVASVQSEYAIKLAGLAFREEIVARATFGVFVQLRRDLLDFVPLFSRVRYRSNEEGCSLRHVDVRRVAKLKKIRWVQWTQSEKPKCSRRMAPAIIY